MALSLIVSSIGPTLGGVGACLIAFAAFRTLHLVGQRQVEVGQQQVRLAEAQQEAEWQKTFRQQYMAFWTDPVVSKVRGWITNEALYKDLEPILTKRLEEPENLLTPEENEYIESIDRFCAILASIDVLGACRMTTLQAALWDKAYGKFWRNTIRSRDELSRYVDEYWEGLLLKTVE